jgi:hypothetical protein
MQRLICQASDCMYNKHKNCSAEAIHVSNTRGIIYCDTYTERQENSPAAGGKYDAEFGDISGVTDVPTGVSCNAGRCVYNKAFRCSAKDLGIGEPHDSGLCACDTYRSK